MQQRATAELELRKRRRNDPEYNALSADAKAIWEPRTQNVPQQIAWNSDADIIGYGGQAGGGKTDLLIGSALTKHKKSVIFRREATQLRDIIQRSREIILNRGRLNENLLIWRDLPGARTLEFGGVKDAADVEKWRGRPHDLKAFDEATEFGEDQIRFLMGWNRSVDPAQKCQTILAFNPPRSAEGRWVLTFFGPWLDKQHPHPAAPGEIRWYARLDDKDVECPSGEPFEHNGERIKPKSRTFIRAALRDNPDLWNTDYEANLQALPEPLRSQLLYGDFQAGISDDEWQVIPTLWVELAQTRWAQHARPNRPLMSVGVDVARGGKDQTILAPRFGNWFGPLEKHAGSTTADGPTVALLVQRMLTGDAVANMDVIGIGSSAYDHAAQVLGLNVVAVNWAEKSDATDKSGKFGFVNKRAEHWWKFREALDPEHGDGLMLPPDSELLSDLTAPRYTVQSNGIKIESKEDIKVRIGRSPDCGDAVVLALPQTDAAAAVTQNIEYTIFDE